MDKKQITALVETIIARIMANANADQSGDELITEGEARTLLGVQLRRNSSALVAAACKIQVADLIQTLEIGPGTAPVLV